MKPKVKAKPPAKSRKRWLVPVVAILFILLAMCHFRSSPVDEVRRMRAQIAAMESELSPEDKQELIKKMRDQVKELTPEQRRELMMDQQKKKARQMAEFFQLSPEEKQQELDKRIDQLVTRANQPGPGQGGLGGAGAPVGNPADTGAPAPGAFAGKKLSPEQREERRQQMLDYSTPDFRAQMHEYRQLLQNRLSERGMPMQPPGGGPKRI